MTHTPMPWSVGMYDNLISHFPNGKNELGYIIAQCTWKHVRTKKESDANAAYIVKCVNMHEELVNTIKSLFCDPEATPCFSGSDGDRKIIADLLAKERGDV